MLANVFGSFRNTCLKTYKLDSAKFLSASGLAWQAALKKTKTKLDLLNNIDMLLKEEYVTLFIDMQKLITDTLKIMIKVKNRHIQM